MKDYNKLISVFQNEAVGFKNRITLEFMRCVLNVRWGTSHTRQIRKAIHELRVQGVLIISNAKNSGYWITTKELIESDPEEKKQVEIMLAETYSRMKKLKEIADPLRKALNKGDQLEFNY